MARTVSRRVIVGGCRCFRGGGCGGPTRVRARSVPGGARVGRWGAVARRPLRGVGGGETRGDPTAAPGPARATCGGMRAPGRVRGFVLAVAFAGQQVAATRERGPSPANSAKAPGPR